MREILFRGQIKFDNGEYKKGDWVYGELVTLFDGKEPHPHIYGKGEVKGETVGQFTGLYDSTKWKDLSTEEQAEFLYPTNGGKRKKEDWKGRPIFEGDIVILNANRNNTICTVSWAETVAQFQLWQINTIPKTPTALNLGNYDCEVIGNIHDNKLEDFKNGC